MIDNCLPKSRLDYHLTMNLLLLAQNNVPIAKQTMKSFHARLLKRELTLKNSAKDTDVKNDKTLFCKEEYWQWRSQLEKHPHTRIIKGTSWSLLGPRVEVGLTPNFMKGIRIFPLSIVGSFFILFYQVNWMCNAWSQPRKNKTKFCFKTLLN